VSDKQTLTTKGNSHHETNPVFAEKGKYNITHALRSNSRLLGGKPEGKRPLGRPRRRWIDNIKMDLLEIGVNVVDWIGLAQDR
jgi:hypothetical protein